MDVFSAYLTIFNKSHGTKEAEIPQPNLQITLWQS